MPAESSATLSALLDAYLQGAADLRCAVAGLSPEQARARPVPGRWSTLEVVCHLADFEPIHAARMKAVVAEEHPLMIGYNESRFAAGLGYHDRDLEEEVALIDLVRRTTARALRQLPDAALKRAGAFREGDVKEERSLEDMLRRCIKHVTHHIGFIMEKRRALGLA
jgi:uncharacterized damage-inducible protein DinB